MCEEIGRDNQPQEWLEKFQQIEFHIFSIVLADTVSCNGNAFFTTLLVDWKRFHIDNRRIHEVKSTQPRNICVPFSHAYVNERIFVAFTGKKSRKIRQSTRLPKTIHVLPCSFLASTSRFTSIDENFYTTFMHSIKYSYSFPNSMVVKKQLEEIEAHMALLCLVFSKRLCVRENTW